MTGTSIITELLLADAWFADLAAGQRLREDRLPDGTPLTAVLLRTVSGVDRIRLTRGAFVRTTDRVALTVRAASVRDRKDAIARARKVCADRTGTFAGCFRVSVLTAGLSPSLIGPGDSYEQTQDFRVSFDAPV